MRLESINVKFDGYCVCVDVISVNVKLQFWQFVYIFEKLWCDVCSIHAAPKMVKFRFIDFNNFSKPIEIRSSFISL